MKYLFVILLAHIMLCVSASTDVPEPAALLTAGSQAVKNNDGIRFDLSITMSVIQGQTRRDSTVAGTIVLGRDNRARIALETGEQNIEIFNAPWGRMLYQVNQGKYRKQRAEPERSAVVASMLSGPVEHVCRWLAAYLSGIPAEGNMIHVDRTNGDDPAFHTLSGHFPGFELRLWLDASTPPLPRRFEAILDQSIVAQFMRGGDAGIEIAGRLDNWDLSCDFSDADFVFTPPAGVVEEKPDAPKTQRDPLVGTVAPTFSLEDLDGRTVRLEDHRGQDIVILDFWASWCGPCRRAMPIVARVAEKFKARNVVLYAVNVREDKDKASAFLNSINLTLPTLFDTTGRIGASYGLTGIPRLIIIGKDGKIKSVHQGMSPALEASLTEELESLLAE